MPRNGSSLYYIPPGTEGFPDTTIESEKYNNYIHDVETDLNLPRPVVTGGTGATTANGALINLGAEKAGQEVDNFDSYAFMAGSFYSTISTTAPPVAGHLFSGIAHITNASNMVLEAIDLTDALNTPWTRVKTSGVWGPWMQGVTKIYIDTHAPVTSSDTPPTGNQAVDSSLWWETDHGQLYIRYNDGNSTQWVVASPVPDVSSFASIASPIFVGDPTAPTPPVGDSDTSIATSKFVSDVAVRYDMPQTLTGPQQQQALQNIYAAPADAMAYSGMQVNGGMEVSQERGLSGTSTSGTYICDGWIMYFTGSMVTAGGLTSPNDLAGFPNRLGMATSTAQASLGAGDFSVLMQGIEGYRLAKLAWGTASAQPITIAFWSAHNRTGLFSVSIRNGVAARSYVGTYTQTAAGVWQYNTITVPGDTTGTWTKDNTAGMFIAFSNGTGTTLIASSANTWLAGSYHAAPGQVNNVTTTSDFFKITGVTVLPGIEAPSAGRSAFIMRPYDQELVTCKRYWQTLAIACDIQAGSAGHTAASPMTYTPEMRVAPTLNGTVAVQSNAGSTGFGSVSATNKINFFQMVSAAAGRSYWYGTVAADARL